MRVATEAPLVQTVDTHTHSCVYIYMSLCVCAGAEQQLNISLRTLLSDCCSEWRGERGGVSVFDICISATSGITFLTSERSLIQHQEETNPCLREGGRKGRGDADGGGLQQSGWEGQERDKIAFPGNEDGHHGNCS